MKKTIDRTYLAVRRQMEGMLCSSYEVGILERHNGKMFLQIYTPEQLLRSVNFLKSKNAKGCDIYVRPSNSQGLILMDDLGMGTLNRMEENGDHPAAIIQTSPQNYQAWIRVSETPLPKEHATQIAKTLASEYQTDPNSADWRHFGRLAGYTNLKPEHKQANGRAPFVLAETCTGILAPNSATRLREATKALEAHRSKQGARNQNNTQDLTLGNKLAPAVFYRHFEPIYRERYGSNLDVSRMDFAILRKMLGQYTTQEMAQALKEASPYLDVRKNRHEEDYISRTVRSVLEQSIQTSKGDTGKSI